MLRPEEAFIGKFCPGFLPFVVSAWLFVANIKSDYKNFQK